MELGKTTYINCNFVKTINQLFSKMVLSERSIQQSNFIIAI